MDDQVTKGRYWNLKILVKTGTLLGLTDRDLLTVRSHIRGSGNYSTTDVSSTSTRMQTIFLELDDGTEKSIEIRDMNLMAREGHRLTAILLIRAGRTRGYYTHILNHNTKTVFQSDHLLKEMMGQRAGIVLALLLSPFIGAYILDIIFTPSQLQPYLGQQALILTFVLIGAGLIVLLAGSRSYSKVRFEKQFQPYIDALWVSEKDAKEFAEVPGRLDTKSTVSPKRSRGGFLFKFTFVIALLYGLTFLAYKTGYLPENPNEWVTQNVTEWVTRIVNEWSP